MVASIGSYLRFPNAVFSQGGADAGEKYHRLVNPCTQKNYRGVQWKKKKAEVVRVWQRGGSRSQQQQLLQGSDANLSLAERYFPLWRCETLQLVWV